MPLLLDREIENNTRLAVWEIQEPNAFFISELAMSKSELKAYDNMEAHRQKEWLASRFLLHHISLDKMRKRLEKTSTGKPYRAGCNKCISLSHSKQLVAAIISDKKVGIDIQKEESKISRIQHKFISPEESAMLPDDNLMAYYHVFWGAKEGMYKAYGLKELEFKDHMHVYPFSFYQDSIELKGWVHKDEIFQEYDISVEKIAGAYLICCIMNNEQTEL